MTTAARAVPGRGIDEADDEIDFAEDDYLRALRRRRLGLPDSALAGMTVDIESDELQDTFEKVEGPAGPAAAEEERSDKHHETYAPRCSRRATPTSLLPPLT